MRHTRAEVIRRTVHEFEQLDQLIAHLSSAEWSRPLARPESRDPWTVKDAVVHLTYRKSNMLRLMRHERRPADERGMSPDALNHLIYMRWRDRSPGDVLAWHRQVQADLLAALKSMPMDWFSGRERGKDWPYHLVGHPAFHRIRDIEAALDKRKS